MGMHGFRRSGKKLQAHGPQHLEARGPEDLRARRPEQKALPRNVAVLKSRGELRGRAVSKH